MASRLRRRHRAASRLRQCSPQSKSGVDRCLSPRISCCTPMRSALKAPAVARGLSRPTTGPASMPAGILVICGAARMSSTTMAEIAERNARTDGVVGAGVMLGCDWPLSRRIASLRAGSKGDFGWTNAHGVGTGPPEPDPEPRASTPPPPARRLPVLAHAPAAAAALILVTS